jgi:hypothetical protein
MKHSGKSDERVFGEGGALYGHCLLFVSRISLTANPHHLPVFFRSFK